MNLICSWAGITSDGIKVGCDGLSALNKAFNTWPLEPSDPHFDLLSALWKMISSSPVTWTTQHIAGHQDNDPNAKFDWRAEHNTNAQPCQGFLDADITFSSCVLYPISDEGFQVWLGNRKLSSHQASTFFDHIHGKTILNYWHASHHSRFLPVMPSPSILMPAPPLSNVFHWAIAAGCRLGVET